MGNDVPGDGAVDGDGAVSECCCRSVVRDAVPLFAMKSSISFVISGDSGVKGTRALPGDGGVFPDILQSSPRCKIPRSGSRRALS